ncbi:serine/threonine protein kinase [Serinicoccus hydrothermalis]|uniref:non-specific serine/threonine protein kinase n=1 Tax=Serinicoccus hydrothermalis TaxID=1758689 RepID=A0A1B1NAH6_9MICO|nr:serine/threonine-protein kinase [Serinicoccus hydrothermalis]ANS78437.1 serine/threonine protein kinase [Serinicoccus hydrothermalis]
MTDPHDADHDAETTAPAPADQDPTLVAGRYRIVRTLGKGGGGQVWLATDENLGRQVALKQVAGETDTDLLLSRGFREARTSATLAHQHVVRVYDAFEHDDSPWIVMEYVEGPSLAELIADGRRLPPDQVAAIGAQMATALAAAHKAGILHRDVKPANVLLTGGAGHDAKLTDFGIARADEDPQLTRTGFVSGTAAYFSPELARGEEPSTASDVWALGATLYAAVEGRRPFAERANAVAQLHTIARDAPRPPEQAGDLTPVLAGMLDPDPAARWSAERAARELARVARGGTTEARPGIPPAAAAAAGAAGATGVADRTERVPQVDQTRTFARTSPPAAASRAKAPVATPQREQTYARPAPRPAQRSSPRRGVWLSWLLIVPLALLLGWLVWTIATGSEGMGGTANQDPGASESAEAGTEAVSADEARDLAQRFYDTLGGDGLQAARQLTLPDAYVAPDIEEGLQSLSVGDLSAQEQGDGSATVTGLVTYTYDVAVIEQEETLTVVRGDDGPVIAVRNAVEVQNTPVQQEEDEDDAEAPDGDAEEGTVSP